MTNTFQSAAIRSARADARPIFRCDCSEYAIFYTPGCLCVVDESRAAQFEASLGVQENGWAGELWRRATAAQIEERRQHAEPFLPECLTLYLNNECNLHCVYCYAASASCSTTRLDLATIAAAARVVAKNCRQKGCPFSIVFHGGGEPTLHHEQLAGALDCVEAIASEYRVTPFRYVATNGILSEKNARELARRFDLIGLSCDGPPDIQNRQRPSTTGAQTARTVTRTAHILREEGGRFHVRATITRASLPRQAEIADYICRQLLPAEIYFEPVYVGGRTQTADRFEVCQAEEFVSNFLAARTVAWRHGIPLQISGSRPASVHGPYCHVFRDVLSLVPGGVATACFKLDEAAHVRAKGAVVGGMNRETGRFEIEHERIQTLREQLSATPSECASCFNQYHCVRECPDRCGLDDRVHDFSEELRRAAAPQRQAGQTAGFRCQLQKALIQTTLITTAAHLWSAATEKTANSHTDQSSGVYGTVIL
jgi:sulfatase maturation enzyme AslB (radical SAM superfamily)